jgi:hypothetical protein
MTSLRQSVLSKDKIQEYAVPNNDSSSLQHAVDASKPSDQIATSSLLKPTTPSQSLQSSSISSIPQRQPNNDEEDQIQPVESNGFHDSPPSPLRRRRTRGATVSEHTEAWDKSYVFSFGIYILALRFLLRHTESLNRWWRCSRIINAIHSEAPHAPYKAT